MRSEPGTSENHVRTCRCAFVRPGTRRREWVPTAPGCKVNQRPRRESGILTRKCPTTFSTQGLKFCKASQSTLDEERSTPASLTPALHRATSHRPAGRRAAASDWPGAPKTRRGGRGARVARGAGNGGVAGLPSSPGRRGGEGTGVRAWSRCLGPARCAPPPPARRPRVRREPRASCAPARPLPPTPRAVPGRVLGHPASI